VSELQAFVADLLERRGAAVERLEPDRLEVLAPAALQRQLGWPEFAHLNSGTQRSEGTIAIGLEGDWLERFGALLADQGRWSERELRPSAPLAPPSDPERMLDRAFDLPNAVWRLQGMSATWTRCLMLTFRFTAVSNEKREGLISLGFNLATGAVINDILARLRPALAQPEWHVPAAAMKRIAGWSEATLASRIHPLLDGEVRESVEPFLRAMRRRLERDRNRIHAYHDELRRASLKRLETLARAEGEPAGRPATRDASSRGDRARIPRQTR